MEILEKLKIPKIFIDWAIKRLEKDNGQCFEDKKKIVENQKKECANCDRKLNKLIEMRINGELSEDEFVSRKNTLNEEKMRLKAEFEQPKDTSASWIEKLAVMKDTLNLGHDALEKFKNGGSEKQQEVFRKLGSNLCLKAKKLNVKAQNKLIGLERISLAVNAIHKRFEPLDLGLNKEKLELAYSSSPTVLRSLEEVRTALKKKKQQIATVAD